MHIALSTIMASTISLAFLTLILISFRLSQAKVPTDLQTYIVQLKAPAAHLSISDAQKRETWYKSILSAILSSGEADDNARVVHFYHHVFPGFAARLTSDELEALKQTEGFISARPDQVAHLQTTHSPSFLGLQEGSGFWNESNYGEGMIIGVVDSGINDNHVSFGDEGMPPPPSKWKGSCEDQFRCNNKIIGARSFVHGTPVDETGHGTHVAGIAAGNFVPNVQGFGGRASGIAPRAHLAIYRVCSREDCYTSDVVAAFDAGINDGVDILSMSLSFEYSPPYFDDFLAIIAFSAIKRGIFVSASAGNRGPSPTTVCNTSPWVLTVGASTTDRKITDTIRMKLDGFELQGTEYGDVHAPMVANFSSRGPNEPSPGILKPDVIGPGFQIISASNSSATTFTIFSGTSMACPHLSGVVALIKKAHPSWSPAAIKSAIMTTSYQTNLGDKPIEDGKSSAPANAFAMGAGHVNPTKANDPGLVYDLRAADYIPYLCGLGYTSDQVHIIVNRRVDCETTVPIAEAQLNYPSFSIRLGSTSSVSSVQTVIRTLTSVVDRPNEVYDLEFIAPSGVEVSVAPKSLSVRRRNQKLIYNVTFARIPGAPSGTFDGYLQWRSTKHLVRSPIVVELLDSGM